VDRHDLAEPLADQIGNSFSASLIERKMTPARSSSARKVVATETLSNTASTATACGLALDAGEHFCSSIGMPSFS
jgi:hypothetical protein